MACRADLSTLDGSTSARMSKLVGPLSYGPLLVFRVARAKPSRTSALGDLLDSRVRRKRLLVELWAVERLQGPSVRQEPRFHYLGHEVALVLVGAAGARPPVLLRRCSHALASVTGRSASTRSIGVLFPASSAVVKLSYAPWRPPQATMRGHPALKARLFDELPEASPALNPELLRIAAAFHIEPDRHHRVPPISPRSHNSPRRYLSSHGSSVSEVSRSS